MNRTRSPAVFPRRIPCRIISALAAVAALASAPAQAAPGGQLHTLIQGPWTCEMPSDATVLPTPKPDENFRIAPDSSYVVGARGQGTYLLLGDRLTMTSGPFNGRRYVVDRDFIAHRLGDDGRRTLLRCVRAGSPAGGMADSAQGDSAD